MLRAHLLRRPQSDPSRSHPRRDRPCHKRLDRHLYRTSVAQLPARGGCIQNHHRPRLPRRKPHQAQGAIPLHADLRKQGRGHGLLKPAPARPDLDNELSPRRTSRGSPAAAKVPPRAQRKTHASRLRRAREQETGARGL